MAPFPRVWTEAGRVLRMFFQNTGRIPAVTGRVLRLVKGETGHRVAVLHKSFFAYEGKSLLRHRQGATTPKGERAGNSRD